jgi:hypothetical protein
MKKQTVLSVGCQFVGSDIDMVPYDSDWSLLDAEIVLFQPSLGTSQSDGHYDGKPLLTKTSSPEVVERVNHWCSELKGAFSAGKLVVIFLNKPIDVYVHTGQQQHSGTGRSRVTTDIVRSLSSYAALPFLTTVTPKSGYEIAANGGVSFFAPLWTEFGEHFPQYEVWIDGKFTDILVRTKTGNRVVGAAIRSGGGTILFLPPLRFNTTRSTSKGGKKNAKLTQTRFAKKLCSALFALSDSLRKERTATPAPTWVLEPCFVMPQEVILRARVQEATNKKEEIEIEIRALQEQLSGAGSLRRLLFEQGDQLEEAILESLCLMGFAAASFADGDSQFDAVLVGPEGRIVGEAEGRDNRAINIEKFSQLERNIHEDFEKAGVTAFLHFLKNSKLTPPA